ncbi:hypothetical protein GJ744_009428 [Endocarpon pusillum]|uniref:O-methyltransferase domain-containing protein n=1 Tax=Endocarpon pusillum TaxID=364733 RepID=A0A8H7AG11_9EURO|nr:hypothetical protein GJ744_009428 [Endocarpon pusillum]
MDSLSSQVRASASRANEAERKKIIDGLRDLAFSIESPEDTMQRIMFQHLQIAGARIGIDLNLFNVLATSSPLTTRQFAQAKGANEALMGRLLRYLASVGMIKETGQDTFAATNITQTLATPGWQAGVRHYFDNCGPVFQKLPEFLARTKYQAITDNAKCVLQPAFNINVPAFIWLQQNPARFATFQQYMMQQREGMPTWLTVYPVVRETKEWDPERPVFVDVGGGLGHQCAALKAKYPDLRGRVILQDLPHAIEAALSTPGVQNMVHDFFSPQPVKGAKYYYMRNILHDYPDDKCLVILKYLIAAMSKESVLLIDDMVLPNSKVHWQAAQLDITLMASLASVERTKAQWLTLLDRAGLKVVNIYTYTVSLQDSIIAAVPKQVSTSKALPDKGETKKLDYQSKVRP